MKNKVPDFIPKQECFINPTLEALRNLGGSGKNDEIYDEVLKIMDLNEEAIDYLHLGSESQTEIQYRLAWARTYLKTYGAIENSDRSVWVLISDFKDNISVDASKVMTLYRSKKYRKEVRNIANDEDIDNEAENVNETADLPEVVLEYK